MDNLIEITVGEYIKQGGYITYISSHSSGYVKIGRSHDPFSRVKTFGGEIKGLIFNMNAEDILLSKLDRVPYNKEINTTELVYNKLDDVLDIARNLYTVYTEQPGVEYTINIPIDAFRLRHRKTKGIKVKKDISITFSISTPIKVALDKICLDNNAKMAEVMRAALNLYLSTHHPHGLFLSWMEEEDLNIVKCAKSVLTNPQGF